MAPLMKTTRLDRGALPRRISACIIAAFASALMAAPSLGAGAAASPSEIKARAIFLPEAPDFDVVRPIYAAGPAIVEDIKIGPDAAVTKAQVQYDQSVNELMKQKLALLEVDSRIAQMQKQRYEQFAPLSHQIEDQRIALGELESQYEFLRIIRAPSDGIVNPIFITRGASIDAKDVLMTLSNANPTLQAYAFVDIADVPLLKQGSTVSLMPAHARKDIDQPLSGTIRSISKTPLSRAEARNLFFDDDAVAYFIPGSIVYLVRIALAANTPEGVVGSGDLATLQIQTLVEQRP